MTTVTVKPALQSDDKPLVIRNPATGLPLPPEGAPVKLSPYWHQRLAHGDVAEAAPPTAPDSTPAEAAPEPTPETPPEAPKTPQSGKTKAKE